MHPRSRLATLVPTLIALAAIVAACSSAGASPSAATTPSPAATAPSSPAATDQASAGAGVHTVTVVQDATLGAYLAGDGGKTLYVLTKDAPNVSNCTGSCAANWPPFTLPSGDTVVGAAGATQSFGTITRADGTMQVTYGGAPLYYFVGDSAAGQTNGQGLNGVWFVVAAGGGPGGAPSASPTTKGRTY
jgi:predicted lipoprotein with Yx(FWY)xxD motif